jgi:hypothetical protein
MTDVLTIGVDFDGTVVEHSFPYVGQDAPGSVSALKSLIASGHQLVLFTMRSDEYLADAVGWFVDRGIPLYGINTNPTQSGWTKSPKAYANIYIDDAALGCPMIKPDGFERKCVDWERVMELLADDGVVSSALANTRKYDAEKKMASFSGAQSTPTEETTMSPLGNPGSAGGDNRWGDS